MRCLLLLILLTLPYASAKAQWMPWAHEAFGDQPGTYSRPPVVSEPQKPEGRDRPQRRGSSREAIRDGSQRPNIEPRAPEIVAFGHDHPASSIVIDTSARRLYYVLGKGEAYSYPISVGKQGFTWTGIERISRKQSWPDWYPPVEMRERDTSLPSKMTGGLRNPLGAMALYLGDTLYRIHGTNDTKSIGQAQSSGCFRMTNAAILHLASLAEIGAQVTVVTALPKGVDTSHAPQHAPGPQPTSSQSASDLRDDMLRRR
jgi:lipoprotein-anchoring transpeptidase ErfK/SrfK